MAKDCPVASHWHVKPIRGLVGTPAIRTFYIKRARFASNAVWYP